MILLLCSLAALAAPLPYGVPSDDPYADGYPSAAERELHLWTNAVRVDPGAFEGDYPCGMGSFTDNESSPHDPLFLDMGLAEAARYHSQDMNDSGNFSHDSSDGTSFGERVGRYYTDSGMIGENIAWNYPDPWSTVFEGWMCSDGHRANIMTDYLELGTGVVNAYYTQDFGGGAIDTDSPIAMGAHTPVDALSDADFLADWLDDDAPASIEVVIDGTAVPLLLRYGAADRGVYGASVKLEPLDCHRYRFLWEDAAGDAGAFPEAGSYTWGTACDDAIGWVEDENGGSITLPSGPDGDDTHPKLDDPRLVGCSSSSSSPAPAAALIGGMLLLPLARRRRS